MAAFTPTPAVNTPGWAVAGVVGCFALIVLSSRYQLFGVFDALNRLFLWTVRYVLLIGQVVLIAGVATGQLDLGLGLVGLFWHERPWTQFWNGMAFGWHFGVVFYVIYLLNRSPRHPPPAPPPPVPPHTCMPCWWPALTPFALQQAVRWDRLGRWARDTCVAVRSWARRRPTARYLARRSLFPGYFFPPTTWGERRDRATMAAVGHYMIRVLVGAVALLAISQAIPAFREPSPSEYWSKRGGVYPALLGVIGAWAVAWLLHFLDELFRFRVWVMRQSWFAGQHAMEGLRPRVRRRYWPLHAAAVFLAGVSLALLGLAYAWIWLRGDPHSAVSPIRIPAFIAVSLIGIVVTMFGGFVAFQSPRPWLLFALLVLWAVVANSIPFKLTIPGLEHVEPIPIGVSPVGHDLYDAHVARVRTTECGGLIPDEEPLKAIHDRWQKDHPSSKPRIFVVAASGGGIRAAVWTALVLEDLESALPRDERTAVAAVTGAVAQVSRAAGFRDHLRLFTGASGGMVGAGYYAADFERPPAARGGFDRDTGLGEVSGVLAKDSLTPTVQATVLFDLPSIWLPGRVHNDRGRALEDAWKGNANDWEWISPSGRPQTVGRERFAAYGLERPLERSFQALAPLEREGCRPSLIYSPVLVEDARRLYISNLDLSALALELVTHVGSTSHPTGRYTQARHAIELFGLFPHIRGRFQVGTAARLGASFPYVSPAVELPVNPSRRVVDAGYVDPTGVETAAWWIFHNRELLRRYTSGVALIQIRAYRSKYGHQHLAERDPREYDDNKFKYMTDRPPAEQANHIREWAKKPDSRKEMRDPIPDPVHGVSMLSAFAFLSSPFETASNARGRTAYFRSQQLLDMLDSEFNPRRPVPFAQPERPFFVTTEFELDSEAALSWYLPEAEVKGMVCRYFKKVDRKDRRFWTEVRIQDLRHWFGTGGGP